MTPEVIKAQVETLRTWAEQWSHEDKEGCAEVAMLLKRAAKMGEAIALDEPFVFEEPTKPDAPVEDPREG